jgi:hypothetical protein
MERETIASFHAGSCCHEFGPTCIDDSDTSGGAHHGPVHGAEQQHVASMTVHKQLVRRVRLLLPRARERGG